MKNVNHQRMYLRYQDIPGISRNMYFASHYCPATATNNFDNFYPLTTYLFVLLEIDAFGWIHEQVEKGLAMSLSMSINVSVQNLINLL